MQLVQFHMQNDAAHTLVEHLGKYDIIEFRDLNAGVQFHRRVFSDDVKKCDDILRKLRGFATEMQVAGIKPTPLDEQSEGTMSLPDLEAECDQMGADLRVMSAQRETLMRNDAALREQERVLYKGEIVLQKSKMGQPQKGKSPYTANYQTDSDSKGTSTSSALSASGLLSCVTGTMPSSEKTIFEKTCYRLTRGNATIFWLPIKHKMPFSDNRHDVDETASKEFFMMFVASDVIKNKLSKIASYFSASIYEFPDSQQERDALKISTKERIAESKQVLDQTNEHRATLLNKIAKIWNAANYYVSKERYCYDTMNMFDFDPSRKVFSAEGWVTVKSYLKLKHVIGLASVAAGMDNRPILSVLETKDEPPTSFPKNEFTSGFQALVDTYGIPRYREVNPGPFAVVQFPFLFGIMFGDIGHGFLLGLFGYLLIRNADKMSKIKDDMVVMCYGGRYVILLNGICGVFVGTLYNEIFGIPTELQGPSAWSEETQSLDPDNMVFWGVDAAWHKAANKITYFNSIKMKISIVVGVLQMTFGIFLSLLNHIEFKDWKRVVFQFIPEITFFMSIFGYLVFLIFLKWSTPYVALGLEAPSLLNALIAMFMSPGQVEIVMFPGQAMLQNCLVVLAVIMVPLLLFPIPYIEKWEHQRQMRNYQRLTDEGEKPDELKPFEFGDAFIHQVIHTIEFVLGTISNTASYLRLWALSLAHAELSELFWEKIVVMFGLNMHQPVFAFIAIFMWILVSFGVLMIMENLSSFLHALRLQWVEFQNKFYHGDGIKFAPFSFASLLVEKED